MSFVLLEVVPPIATITLNRPERHNSLIPDMLREFLAALEAIRARSDVRVVILQANGKSFSTGGDVKAFATNQDEIEAYAYEIVGLLNEVVLGLLELPLPVVAAVQGIVTGGALGLVLACDLVVLSEQASFTPFYSVVGFSPDGGWTALLPKLIGQKRTAQVLLLNETITASQALAWGLVSKVVATEQVRAEAVAVAQQLLVMRAGSLRRAKLRLWSEVEQVARDLESERVEFVRQITTEEARLGMAQFLANRV